MGENNSSFSEDYYTSTDATDCASSTALQNNCKASPLSAKTCAVPCSLNASYNSIPPKTWNKYDKLESDCAPMKFNAFDEPRVDLERITIREAIVKYLPSSVTFIPPVRTACIPMSMENFAHRYESFDSSWPYHNPFHDLHPRYMATLGFFLLSRKSSTGECVVRCYACCCTLRNFNGMENPLISHVLYSPGCKILKEFFKNLPEDSSLYRYKDVRTASYVYMGKRNLVQNHTPVSLAAAGLHLRNGQNDLYESKCWACKHVVTRRELITSKNPTDMHSKTETCEHLAMFDGLAKYCDEVRDTAFDE